jgi:hypothetical protein
MQDKQHAGRKPQSPSMPSPDTIEATPTTSYHHVTQACKHTVGLAQCTRLRVPKYKLVDIDGTQ